MAEQNYYKILGLQNHEADQKKIRKAFRGKSLNSHPDITAGELRHNTELQPKEKEKILKEATEKFQLINEAYQVLSDPEKKRDHDLSLKDRGFFNNDKIPNSKINNGKWEKANRSRNENGRIVINDLIDVISERLCYQYIGSPNIEVERETTLHDAVMHGFKEVEDINFYEDIGKKLRDNCFVHLQNYIRNYFMINMANVDLGYRDHNMQTNGISRITFEIDDIRQELKMKNFYDDGGTFNESKKRQETKELMDYMIENREEIMRERAELRGNSDGIKQLKSEGSHERE